MSKKKGSERAENVVLNVDKKHIRRRIRYKGTFPWCGSHKWVTDKVYKRLNDK